MSAPSQKSASKDDDIKKMFKTLQPFKLITTSKDTRAKELAKFTTEYVDDKYLELKSAARDAKTDDEVSPVVEIATKLQRQLELEIKANESFEILSARLLTINRYKKGLEAIDEELGDHLDMSFPGCNPVGKVVILETMVDPKLNVAVREMAAHLRNMADSLEWSANEIYGNEKLKPNMKKTVDSWKKIEVRTISKDEAGSKLSEEEALEFIGRDTVSNGATIRSIGQEMEGFDMLAQDMFKGMLDTLVDDGEN